MDPAFAALLDQMRQRGWTDQMFAWLADAGTAEEWAARVRRIEAVMLSPNLTPEQRNLILGSGGWDVAQRYFPEQPVAPAPATPGGGGVAAPLPQEPVVSVPTTPTTPTTPSDRSESAFASIKAMLDAFGLGSVASWAWKRFQDGASIDQIMIELYQRPEFKEMYPEYDVLAKKGRAYSVAELQAYRKAVVGIYRMYGIPESFYDQPSDLAALAGAEISIAEVSKRVAKAAESVYQSSPLVRAEMERMWGVSSGDLIAFWLDPDKAEPLLTQRYTAAQIGAGARQTTWGTLTADEATRLAGLGVDAQTAQQGFGTLAGSRELFGALDRGETDITRETQLGAAFAGDVTAQQQIEQRRGRRKAEFAKGGGFATNSSGIVGLTDTSQ